VAHNRYLLDRLPTLVIEVGNGKAVRYLGNDEDYLRVKATAARMGSRGTPARASR
jgi:ATPase subunit of ABC transporter with duplicated ATPase domains